MNYLAHIYLSGNRDHLKIGNFIADFIYGNNYKNFNEEIQKGILLHRKIDSFTDAHPVFRRSKKRLFTDFRHYSAVIVDMFYDHFLALNFSDYSSKPLDVYVSRFYELMNREKQYLPDKVKNLLPIMIEYNWLESYKDLEKLTDILAQMNNRTKHASQLHLSVNFLKKDYDIYESEFKVFFKDLLEAKKEMYKSLNID